MPLIEGLVVTIHLPERLEKLRVGRKYAGCSLICRADKVADSGRCGRSIRALIGADAAVHLAEELKDASYILPRAMVSSALMNYATALTMIISFVSAIDPALLDDVLATSTGVLSNSE
ncbi:hypothetical protein LTR32_006436 [Rachicladosporium monterosium]|uniref:Uncharacterized protein n=1 Tax=Rachicladosporium monterosium TaxID=1507873 RepID=A0ABR0KYZ3_9PEZI|nr:hypothetical protein LTR32_006436 [Rachicladosporium monterosium]